MREGEREKRLKIRSTRSVQSFSIVEGLYTVLAGAARLIRGEIPLDGASFD